MQAPSVPAGSHYVYINYPVGRDSFSIKVIGKGVITGATVPTFSAPFQSDVDVKLTGTGLSSIPRPVQRSRIISDSFNQLLDAGGQAASGVSVTAQPDTSTNTDTQVLVRLELLTEADPCHYC